MTQEQKAKAYDEALEWMRELYPGLHGATKKDAEHYFPELKEIENERIIRAIIDALYSHNNSINLLSSRGYQMEDIKAWLEKQKEQKPITINQNEKEFLADEITAFLCNYDKEFDGEDPVPSEVAEHFYLLGKQAQEQKPAEYLSKEKVFAIMNKLTSLSFCVPLGSDEEKKIHEITCDVSSLLDYPIEQKSAEWSEEDKQNYKVICSIIHGTYVIETQETQDKLLSWLKSLKPQPMQEQKPAEWNEEDEDMLNSCISSIEESKENRYAYKENDGDTSYDREIAWLKSLRPVKQEQKPEAKLTGWVARDKEFDSYLGIGLILFDEKPRRSFDTWSGEIVSQLPWRLFPDLKWVDPPMEVEVTIRRK